MLVERFAGDRNDGKRVGADEVSAGESHTGGASAWQPETEDLYEVSTSIIRKKVVADLLGSTMDFVLRHAFLGSWLFS